MGHVIHGFFRGPMREFADGTITRSTAIKFERRHNPKKDQQLGECSHEAPCARQSSVRVSTNLSATRRGVGNIKYCDLVGHPYFAMDDFASLHRHRLYSIDFQMLDNAMSVVCFLFSNISVYLSDQDRGLGQRWHKEIFDRYTDLSRCHATIAVQVALHPKDFAPNLFCLVV